MREITLNYREVEEIKEKLQVNESQITDAIATVGCDVLEVEHYLSERLMNNNGPR